MTEIAILEGEYSSATAQLGSCRALSSPKDLLPSDPLHSDWRQTLECYHRSEFLGAGETVAVIDTGFDLRNPHLKLAVNTSKSLDFTGEGLNDRNGHGTRVSMIVTACAPAAEIIHIKAFDLAGRIRGGEPESILSRAIREAAHRGATIINISAGYYRTTESSKHLLHASRRVCDCEICRTVEEVSIQTGVSVFAAAGNYGMSDSSEHGDWYCPSMVPCATPVVGLEGSGPIFKPGTTGIWAIAAVGVIVPDISGIWHRPLSIIRRTWRRLSGRPWRGSSFATPIVSGTAAVVRQLFALPGAPNLLEQSNPGDVKTFFETNGPSDESCEYHFIFPLQDYFENSGWSAFVNRQRASTCLLQQQVHASYLANSGRYTEAIKTYRLLRELGKFCLQLAASADYADRLQHWALSHEFRGLRKSLGAIRRIETALQSAPRGPRRGRVSFLDFCGGGENQAYSLRLDVPRANLHRREALLCGEN